MADPRVRVLLADDHPVARRGIVSLLGVYADIEVVGEAANGAEVLAAYPSLRPHVVVTDLRMPTLDGVAVTRALTAMDPDARVLIFSHHDGDEQIYQALRAGARGYLTKDADAESLVRAIRVLASGGRYLAAELAGRYADRVAQPSLSPRERETLALVARGLSNRAIADALGIAERTAAMHVGNLLTKLGAKTRTEAVAIAARDGLLG